jgi:hypothetical protein
MKIIYVIPDYYEGKPNIATSVFFITFWVTTLKT